MKKNQKTTITGIVIAIVLTLFGLLQPMFATGAGIDWQVFIPAAVIAIVHLLQKKLDHWQATVWLGGVFSALLAGATAFQTAGHDWLLIVGSIFSAVGGYLIDKQKTKLANSKPPTYAK